MRTVGTTSLLALLLRFCTVAAVPGGKEAYPVFGPYVDDYGNQVSGDIEFEFALAAINVVRAQCNDTDNFPPVTADVVTIYDDECTRQTIAGQQVITLSFDVPAARDSIDDVDTIYVMISNVAPIDDINGSDLGSNATASVNDVGITVSRDKDPTGTANDFRLLGIRKLDLDTGDGNAKWTCSFTKADGTYIGSDIGSADGNVTDDLELRRRMFAGSNLPATDIDILESLPIYGRRFLTENVPSPSRREIVADNLSPSARQAILATLPTNYDARQMLGSAGQPPLASVPLNQGACGSCYAFGATSAMAYRLYNKSGGMYNVVPSPQMAMTCSNGCEGGDADVIHDAMVQSYIPAATMQAYTGKVDPSDKAAFCGKNPDPSAVASTLLGSIPYVNRRNGVDSPDIGARSASRNVLGEEAIMQEVYLNGPASVYVQVESLFSTYPGNADTCNGVLTDRKCVTGKGSVVDANGRCTSQDTNHAVTLVGWGVDPDGCPSKGIQPPLKYWIIQNSHGEGWGDCDGIGCGFMKLERGRNTLAVEAGGAVVGFPDVNNGRMCPNSTDPSTWCQNGGSFTTNCTCYCPPVYGFSGPTCNVCAPSCPGGAAPILSPADPLKGRPATCGCPCSKGYWKPPNLAGYTDCGVTAGVWLDSASPQPLPSNLNTTLPDVVYAPEAPATFSVRFAKINSAANSNAQSPHYGDMVVAVKTGSKPWTKELKWDAIKGKLDVCGPKKVENHRVVDCAVVSDAWVGDGYVQATGSIKVTEAGGYDLYFVKYMGQSEFGVDKGFGMDFAKLPQQLWVGSVSNSSRRAAPTPDQLKKSLADSAAANKQSQNAKALQVNAQKISAVTALKDSLEANNSLRQASQELRDRPRTVYLAVILRGISQASFSMTEETAFKAVIANFTSVCTPKDAQGKPLTNASNLTRYGDCTVRDASVQRSARNMTGDISPSAMVVFSYIVTHNTSAVTVGDYQLAQAVSSGALMRALRTSSPRLAAISNLTLYSSPQPLILMYNSSALAAKLSDSPVGSIVQFVSQAGITIGIKRQASSAGTLDLTALSALVLGTDQAGAELAQKTSAALALYAVKVTDLAPGFGAVRLAVAAADELKPLQISLMQLSASRRRAGSMCRLNKSSKLIGPLAQHRQAGALATDACKCPATSCSGAVTCTTNDGSAVTNNSGTWIVQVTADSFCSIPTVTSTAVLSSSFAQTPATTSSPSVNSATQQTNSMVLTSKAPMTMATTVGIQPGTTPVSAPSAGCRVSPTSTAFLAVLAASVFINSAGSKLRVLG